MVLKWYCPQCDRLFTGTHRFEQHLDAKRNAECRAQFDQNPVHMPSGDYDPDPANRALALADHMEDVPAILGDDEEELEEVPNIQGDAHPESANEQDFEESSYIEDEEVSESAYEDANMAKFFQNEAMAAANIAAKAAPDAGSSQDKAANTKIREEFEKYYTQANIDYVELPPELRAAIGLMNILNLEGAPLTAYDKIVEWHLDNIDGTVKVTKDNLLKRLRTRYNMADLAPKAVKTKLPSSGTKLEVPIHDTEAMVRDLLTDPRIKDEDYLFFNDDPLQDPPPDSEWMEVRDLNTGKSFRKTHEELIAPEPYTECGRKKVLCPVVPYMDGCTTGAFMNLSLEIVKFTLGIFNNKARNKECCWRNMGAVPKYVEAKSAAKESIRQSTHTAATDYLTDSDADDDDDTLSSAFCVTEMDCGAYLPSSDDESSDDGSEWGWEDEAEMDDFQAASAYEKYLSHEELREANAALRVIEKEMKLNDATSMPANRAQDLHSILHIILARYKRIQEEGGIEWDLFYKGRLYKLLFIPFVVFVKGDSVEQDKHVGKYGSRTKGVAHLCRHCHCPNKETDDAYANHPRKSQTEITAMVKSKDTDGLKATSQQMLWNAWYELKFGKHNDEGIHGATPLEILHWIQLGQFGYSRESLLGSDQ